MLQFFINGGVPMFGIIICGLVALGAAIRFAMAPDKRKVAAIASLSGAALVGSLLGFAADVMAVCRAVVDKPEWQKPDVMPLILLEGLQESLSPVVLGFSLLVAIGLVMAVGYRRLAPRLPA